MAQPSAHSTPGCGGISIVRDAHLAHDRRAVQRPGAAERHQHEVARIVPLLDRQQPGAPGHALVDDRQDRLGRLLHAQPNSARRAARSRPVRPSMSSAARCFSPIGWSALIRAEHGVGVGHGRLRAAAAEAHRAGHGPGAARPDLQDAAAVQIARCEPPPAPIVCTSIIGRRSGIAEIERPSSRRSRGSPSTTTATSKLVPPMSPVMTLSKPASAASLRRRHHAGRRAGAHDVGGAPAKLRHRHQPAVRLHDQRLRREPAVRAASPAGSARSARPAAADSPARRRCWCARTRNIRARRCWRSRPARRVPPPCRMSRTRSSCAGLA